MVMDRNANAPYAPCEGVLRVIRRFRERGLPERIMLKEMEALGIPAGNAPRVLVALRFLGLIDDEGQRTDLFTRLTKAAEADYATVMAEIIRAAYSAVFAVADPSGDGDTAVNDAFRQYEPQAQRKRMVSLFQGLCREAGIVEGGPITRKPRTRGQVAPRQSGATRRATASTHEGNGEEFPRPDVGVVVTGTQTDYRVLLPLIQQLPKDGKWTKSVRDRWLHMVEATIDFKIEVREEPEPKLAQQEATPTNA